ncbi:hypothetical protein CU633_17170 [Bacillus sp. V3-13]|uniref:hypothetical protein n=1 Tax=Bacillus sp. V3-13 TaxID=2053728 RepID=UPI000C76E35E|nr:hypothetical protein [Bacillus sp. V3-13]PLR76190.1 hypothetical protein CU633_17170 [Bacillus sp. V3-13]
MNELRFNHKQSTNMDDLPLIINDFSQKKVYEVDLLENDEENIDFLITLIRGRLVKVLISPYHFLQKELEDEFKARDLEYEIFTPSKKNNFFTISISDQTDISFLINTCYDLGVQNCSVFFFLDDDVHITYTKTSSKLKNYFIGEEWTPTITLLGNGKCLFMRYDGALLTMVANN